MVKQRLKGSMESFSSHIDPENEEQLKLVKTETESKVEQILQLAKSINKGNKDGNLRKKSQLIKLIEDFHKQYESLYSLYDNLRGEIRQKVYIEDDIDGSPTHSYNSDSDLFYSPKDGNSIDENNPKLEALHIEEYVLKDKLTSTSEVKELSKYPDIETEYSDKMVEKLLIESSWLKEKLSKQEEELLSLSKKHQLKESERLAQIQELETQLPGLKEELEMVKKGEVSKVTNLKKDMETIEIERNKLQQHESERLTQIQELEIQLVDLKQELEKVKNGADLEIKNLKKDLKTLETEKNKLQKQLDSEKKQSLQSLNQTEKKYLELSQIQELEIQLVDLKQEFERVKKGGVSEVINLKKDLKTMESKNNKLQKQLEIEKKEFVQSSNQMKKGTPEWNRIQELEIQLADLKHEYETVQKDGSFEVTNLKEDLKKMETENKKLQKQVGSEKKESLKSLNQMEKRNLELISKVAEKKIDQMAEEFCKHIEDKLHKLSRRIKVAEQLQVEVNEWHANTVETYAQENKDLNNIKETSSTTNDMLNSLDVVALRFEECTTNFMNSISKVSCELKFARDWVMRKNKAISHVEDYQSCLLAQLDEKEAKILEFRERVWKSENKARELGKSMKENEERMLGLKEEKREAIRQLCVWTDYHRSRSEYYKKTLTDISLRFKRST